MIALAPGSNWRDTQHSVHSELVELHSVHSERSTERSRRSLAELHFAINARLFLIEELNRCMRLVSSVSPDQFSKTLALLN